MPLQMSTRGKISLAKSVRESIVAGCVWCVYIQAASHLVHPPYVETDFGVYKYHEQCYIII